MTARTLLLSQAGLKPLVSRCGTFEFEHVVHSLDDADLLVPRVQSSSPPAYLDRVLDRARRSTGWVLSREEKPAHVHVEQDYDLFFVFARNLKDLAGLDAVKNWRRRCRYAVCWLEELWVDWLQWENDLRPLRDFDHVMLTFAQTAEPLSKAIDRPCSYLPPAADTLTFCPFPDPPPRSIDVYSMGRRSEKTHQVLLERARSSNFSYLYDTRTDGPVSGWAEHRFLLANTIKRSRYFVTYKAKVGAEDQTKAQEELGSRFFEGAAAGAVLLGEPPKAASFGRDFDWPDSVVALPWEAEDVFDVMAAFEKEPERETAVRINNVEHCLRRHDWAHRWQQVLSVAKLEPTEALKERLQALEARANLVADSG